MLSCLSLKQQSAVFFPVFIFVVKLHPIGYENNFINKYNEINKSCE